jgi:hypothetical protein
MEHFKSIEKREGCDVGAYGSCDIHPKDREGCVGLHGIDKTYTLDMVMKLAYKMDEKPNILLKAGPNAKWYMKKVLPSKIDEAIEKQKWRDSSRCTMYIIRWD